MFKVIKSFPDYEINEEGVVRRIADGFMPKVRYRDGIQFISLRGTEGYRSCSVHRLVAVAFGKTPDGISAEVLGYPDYVVTESGAVWSKRYLKYLSPHVIGRGYLGVHLHNSSGSRGFLVHRLVAELYLSSEKLDTVNHKDGDKENNHYTNLEWATYSENNQHAIDNGLRHKTLRQEDVHHVCSLLSEKVPCRYIASRLGISEHRVWDIKRRKTWVSISSRYVF